MNRVSAAVSGATTRLVEDMVHAVARAIDEDRLEAFPDFFTADGTYRIASRFNVERGFQFSQMYCASRGMIIDRIVSLRRATVFAGHRYRHLLSGILVESGEDGELRVRASYLVVRTVDDGVPSLFSSGEYRDRIVIENGRALFRERLVILDSKGIDTALVIPL